jgi:hypothetical protein
MLPTLPPASPLDSAPVQFMWNLWWTEWHWDRFFSQAMQIFSVTVIPPVLNIHISFICFGCYVIVATDSVVRYSTSRASGRNPQYPLNLKLWSQSGHSVKEKISSPTRN